MPFGQTLKEGKQRTEAQGDGAVSFAVWPWMSLKVGRRKFRMLPELDENGIVKQYTALDTVGNAIKGKFVTYPESEVRWLEAWWPVVDTNGEKKARFILDPENRWDNPFWKYIMKHFEKGSIERKVVKDRFGVNVLDMSPVIISDDGKVTYANLENNFVIPAYGKVLDKPVEGDPQPLMQVRIFEASAGDKGGKHMLQQVQDLAEELQNPDGKPIQLHEVTLQIKTSGEGTKTNRSINTVSDYKPLPDEFIYAPRYDIAEWARPWPDEMVEKLLEGYNFSDMVEEYGIKLIPELKVIEKQSEVKKSSKRSSKKDEEELFED